MSSVKLIDPFCPGIISPEGKFVPAERCRPEPGDTICWLCPEPGDKIPYVDLIINVKLQALSDQSRGEFETHELELMLLSSNNQRSYMLDFLMDCNSRGEIEVISSHHERANVLIIKGRRSV